MSNNREQWSSRTGFILAAAGSAVGLGNIWKFPYITGVNGGGAFVLVYLLCIVAIGLPIMISEIMLGRRGRRNPITSMELLGREETGSGTKRKRLQERMSRSRQESVAQRLSRAMTSWKIRITDLKRRQNCHGRSIRRLPGFRDREFT